MSFRFHSWMSFVQLTRGFVCARWWGPYIQAFRLLTSSSHHRLIVIIISIIISPFWIAAHSVVSEYEMRRRGNDPLGLGRSADSDLYNMSTARSPRPPFVLHYMYIIFLKYSEKLRGKNHVPKIYIFHLIKISQVFVFSSFQIFKTFMKHFVFI